MPLAVVMPETPIADAGSDVIEIGFLNNLADSALDQGERQLVERLAAASGSARVRLRLFSLSAIERSTACRASMEGRYADETTLMTTRLAGLFVSGAEPQMSKLEEEGFWPQLAAVVDWSRAGTQSAIWSCLAAHAAVLRLDGVVRRRLTQKRAGFFAVHRVVDHPLLDGLADASCVAQSRWNSVEECDLAAAGYEILTRSGSHVDTFVKDVGSLFVFLQGHTEYDVEALGREYRRDVLRFLAGTAASFPSLPARYFVASDEAELEAFALAAAEAPRSAPRFRLPPPRPDLARRTHGFADVFFANWLRMLQVAALEHVA